ncbi:MAG: zinc ABC transporter substrate-binding protein [Lachnospiraceae bacterium]|nr:zinc ABC transporter substrate-binding protein [Lachnospiraceae bacterium]
MQKKKRLSLFLAVLLCMLALTGCQSGTANADTKNGAVKKRIVCTTFPTYDWTREILGTHLEDFELTLLLDKGGDLHSYQPTAGDIATMISADLFVYVGGESDEWVTEVLKNAHNQEMRVVNLMETLGDAVKEEETVRGIAAQRHEHDSDEEEYDEHVWLSLKNASVLTKTLSDNIKQLDEANAEDYAANEKAYLAQLTALDDAYADAVREAKKKTILFGDRFPFRYMTDDYGLDYYAAFTGCSTETDASFETITFLSGKMDELELPAILTIEGSNQRIAEIIKQNTRDKNQEILTMNSLQSVTAKDIEGGFTYLKAMQDNLEVLKKAMN